MTYTLCALLGAALLGLDQWVKWWTSSHFAAPVPPHIHWTADPAREFLPGLVELTRVHNYGAAWSSFSGMRWLLVAATSCIVLAVLVLLVRRAVRHPLGGLAGCLIVSGGLGNIIDRVRLGYVVDMFNFQFMNYPVFNVADMSIVAGCILGLIYYQWFYEKHDKREKSDGNADASSHGG